MTNEEKQLLGKAQRINSWNSKKLYYCVGKRHQRSWTVKRGEVFFVDLGENVGSEENKIRPVVIIQSNSYNISSPVFTCAIISTSPATIPDIQIPITGTYPYTDPNGKPATLSGTSGTLVLNKGTVMNGLAVIRIFLSVIMGLATHWKLPSYDGSIFYAQT